MNSDIEALLLGQSKFRNFNQHICICASVAVILRHSNRMAKVRLRFDSTLRALIHTYDTLLYLTWGLRIHNVRNLSYILP